MIELYQLFCLSSSVGGGFEGGFNGNGSYVVISGCYVEVLGYTLW